MKRKPLWKLSVATTAEAEEAVQELLAKMCAAAPVSYTDAETRRVEVAVYLETRPQATVVKLVREGLARFQPDTNKTGREFSINKIRREDWANSWKRHFHPITVGNALLVKPSWDRTVPKPGQKVVILDPGLSFGTGQHPTTSFCLEQLTHYRRSGKQSLLDAGTGSGILAIAAAKLGYTCVDAFDFDPEAVRVANANGKKNRVAKKIHFSQKDLTKLPARSAHKYDVVCANLISTLLLAEKRRFLNRLADGGLLILAGILATEFKTVATAYEAAGLRPVSTRQEGEWQSGAFVWERI
jgi:ribosomal protein L11 methyltransferase